MSSSTVQDSKGKSDRSYKRDEPQILTPIQISYIRKYNEDINDKYVFEIYFQLGVQRQGKKRGKGLQDCHPQNKDTTRQCFVGSGKPIKYNTKIATLLEEIQDGVEINVDESYVSSYFSRITRYLRDKVHVYFKETDIGHDDLVASHDAYIRKCPNCNELTENIKENWVLAKWESDEEYRLYCSQCKGDPCKGVIPNGN